MIGRLVFYDFNRRPYVRKDGTANPVVSFPSGLIDLYGVTTYGTTGLLSFDQFRQFYPRIDITNFAFGRAAHFVTTIPATETLEQQKG